MTTESSSDVPSSSSSSSSDGVLSQPKQVHIQFMNKEQEKKGPSDEKKCVICKHKHPVAYCPVFKSNHLQERRKITWENGLCFNCLKANHQARNCPSLKRCLKERCGRSHHTLLHEDPQPDSRPSLANNQSSSIQPSTSLPESVRHSSPVSSSLPAVQSNINQVCARPQRKVLLQVLPVQIHSQDSLINTCCS